MNIPPKYEDVVEQLDAALGREADLREELARSNDLLSQARGMVNGATDEWHDEAQKLTGEK